MLAVAKAILMNLMILVPFGGNIDASPNRASLGSGGISILVILDIPLTTPPRKKQWKNYFFAFLISLGE